LSGNIEGSLPIQIKQGTLSWGRGQAFLTPNSHARLRHADKGLLATYIPDIKLSRDLDMNEALRDITLTELHIDIQPSANFADPSIVRMSGFSNHPRITVPIERIQLNIRGEEVPGLLNRTFNTRKWLESLFQRP
jgi:hypothetical protein